MSRRLIISAWPREKSVDKFAAARLTAVQSDLVDAPYVKEFPLIWNASCCSTFEIGLPHQFIGVILDVKADSRGA